MIILFGGRKGSGKTLFSKYLENLGFIKISFASFLKDAVSKLYNFDVEKLYTDIGKSEKLNEPLYWNKEIALKFFNICEIADYSLPIQDQEFYSRREAIQYIGSSVLRKYDINFHIKKTLKNIVPGKNYVCDDVRFKNELDELKLLGAIDFFIIRPNNFDISNHVSEISLKWSDFGNIIINNCKKSILLNNFKNYIKYYNYIPKKIKNHIPITRQLLLDFFETNGYDTVLAAKYFKCSRDKIVWWCKKYFINIKNNAKYFYNKDSFLDASEISAYYAGLLSSDGCIKKSGKSIYNYVVELSSTDFSLVSGLKKYVQSNKPIYRSNNYYSFTIHCPYIIENLKHWNLKPRKSKYNEIPDILKNNNSNNLLKMWMLGLIDGDGSIYFNRGYLCVSLLASKEILYYLQQSFSDFGGHIYPHKNIDNLYEWKFFNKDAIYVCDQLYNKIALKRKWDKYLKSKSL